MERQRHDEERRREGENGKGQAKFKIVLDINPWVSIVSQYRRKFDVLEFPKSAFWCTPLTVLPGPLPAFISKPTRLSFQVSIACPPSKFDPLTKV